MLGRIEGLKLLLRALQSSNDDPRACSSIRVAVYYQDWPNPKLKVNSAEKDLIELVRRYQMSHKLKKTVCNLIPYFAAIAGKQNFSAFIWILFVSVYGNVMVPKIADKFFWQNLRLDFPHGGKSQKFHLSRS